MHVSSLAFLALLIVVNAQTQTQPSPSCLQDSCSSLLALVKECQITVDPTTGNISFPPPQPNVTTPAIDSCLCTQPIINAFDPCLSCAATIQKPVAGYSAQRLVDSCNTNLGANTVKMPAVSAASNTIVAPVARIALSAILLIMLTLS